MHKNCRHYLQLLADLEKRLHILRWYFTKHNAHYDSITVPQFKNEMENVSVDAIMMFIQQKINELKQPVIDCNKALCQHTQKKLVKIFMEVCINTSIISYDNFIEFAHHAWEKLKQLKTPFALFYRDEAE